MLIENDDLTNYKKSLNSSESDKWFMAMKLEMDSMYTNQVWTLVDPDKTHRGQVDLKKEDEHGR